jgi:hypothetical protein
MSLTRTYKTDRNKETQGVAIPFPPNDDGSIPSFTVSRASKANPRYTAAMERIIGPFRAAIARKALPNDQAAKLMRQVFIEGCLMTWNNIPRSDVSGNPDLEGFAEFNEANAETLFDNLPELYEDLEKRAGELDLFRMDELESDAKN